jgi:hypothetical protein
LEPLGCGERERRRRQDPRRPQADGYNARHEKHMSLHDHPPFFSTWPKAYWFAIALFAVEVALLYAFTLRFS